MFPLWATQVPRYNFPISAWNNPVGHFGPTVCHRSRHQTFHTSIPKTTSATPLIVGIISALHFGAGIFNAVRVEIFYFKSCEVKHILNCKLV
ncbi:hypothetical protein RhiirA5_367906 [Rhizophagus irregularis]|uniref:Uncharacterized protein n=2 Tax=Rhizophagus irregularis TaxID=588596 RepID=A0A2N0NN11_9GLOM|nr:hypothetical protein RhiirA5_367906 [Rhizophagus irregularis]GBC51236.1 hypothetical protein RIR_jg26574.t1 [Rhizophagus irregularis DAOM 181602=DAOM 197198]